MALEGTIKDFGLADILQLIGIQRKTGVLTLHSVDDTVTVKFLDGAIVGADTRQHNLEDLLGSVLVRTGRITDAQLQEALRIQKRTLQRLGYILVKQNFTSDLDLQDALRIQVTQIVYRLFRWRDGRYQFTPADHMEYDSEHFQPLSAETILMEGARMIDEWPIIERRIKSPRIVFRKTAAGAALDIPITSILDADIDFGFQKGETAGDGKERLSISHEERDILHMIDGSTTVQDVVDTTPLGEFDVYHLLYELLNRNLIEEVKVTAAVSAAVEAEANARVRWVSIALQGVVFALAAFGVLTLRVNPVTPWRVVSRSGESALLKTYASRSRVERAEKALQVYYLDRGSMPPTLGRLAAEGYLPPDEVIDPWGQPYDYRVDAAGYEISGRGPDGRTREDLVVRHAFSASQRMVLEGGTLDREHEPTP